MANLPKAKKAAIMLKTNPKPEEIIAAAAVYIFLKSQNNSPTVITKNKPLISILKNLISDINIKENLPPKQFIINIKNKETQVNQVQWQQDDQGLSLFLTLSKGTINPNELNLKQKGADYDLVVLPHINELSQLGELGMQNQDFFKDTKLFSIGSELNLGDNYQHTSSNKPNITTLSEQVFYALDTNNIKEQTAQIIFSGIMIETNNLTKPIKSPEIFVTMKKLVEIGAKTDKINNIINKLNIKSMPKQTDTNSNTSSFSKEKKQKEPLSASKANKSEKNTSKNSDKAIGLSAPNGKK